MPIDNYFVNDLSDLYDSSYNRDAFLNSAPEPLPLELPLTDVPITPLFQTSPIPSYHADDVTTTSAAIARASRSEESTLAPGKALSLTNLRVHQEFQTSPSLVNPASHKPTTSALPNVLLTLPLGKSVVRECATLPVGLVLNAS